MKVCPNCFSDKEIKGLISTSDEKGDCFICNSNDVHLLEITELYDFFEELLENFQKVENGEPLRSKIQSNWSFFASHETASEILNSVLPEISSEIISSDDLVDYTSEIKENYNHWETIKEELKWSRRFFVNTGQLEDLGWDGFFNTQYELKSDDLLYRARVHHISGLPAIDISDMLCPPKDKASGGRANPLGIPYLYLCDSKETTLYEVRASYLDELSIGVFKLKAGIEDLRIVDFTEDTSLFQPTMVKNTIKGRLLREKISIDLSKPMRRYDSEIEYIPTQFICEFIKVYTGAEGIRFRSSLDTKGKNIVLFDQNKIKCTKVTRSKITSLKLKAIDL